MLCFLTFVSVVATSKPSMAQTVKVTMHAMENSVVIDNKDTNYSALMFDGAIPGPVVRVKEGHVVDSVVLLTIFF